MKVLLLGPKDLAEDFVQAGLILTSDPKDADVCVCEAVQVPLAPLLPLVVVGTGTVADLAVKSKRPDAVVASRASCVREVLRLQRAEIVEEAEKAEKAEKTEKAASAEDVPAAEALPSALVVVCSNKGGVGKTTVSLGLSLYLALSGISTSLCDFDVDGTNIDAFFKISRVGGLPQGVSASDVALKVMEHLRVLIGRDVLQGTPSGRWGEETLAAVRDLGRDSSVVVVDTPPQPFRSERSWLFPLFRSAARVFVVLDQSKFALREAEETADALLSLADPGAVRIVVNRYDPRLGKMRLVEEALGKRFPIAARIPEAWRKYAAGTHKGKLPDLSVFRDAAEDVARAAGVDAPLRPEKKRLSFLRLFGIV